MSAETTLVEAARTLQVALTESARRQLLEYIGLLHKWNQVYNLTAVREPEQMLAHHVLDSLAVLPHIRGHRFLDVGSGAGLPGIPLAIAHRDAHVTLLDSSHKKTTFLRQAVIELALPHVDVVCERVEAWEPSSLFDVVISRAFSDLREFAVAAGRLCAADGMLAAMKGVHPYEELGQVPEDYIVQKVVPLTVPGLRAQRHLVLMQHASAH